MNTRSKPRYKSPEKGKSQPKADDLPWKPHHAGRSWTKTILVLLLNVFALQILAGLWWVYTLVSSPYRIYFDDRPASVALDGHPQALDSANGFNVSRFTLGDHRVEYTDAAGAAKAVTFHARLDDGDGSLEIGEGRVSGVPKGRFVTGR